MNVRSHLALILTCAILLFAPLRARSGELVVAKDLASDARDAGRARQPLLLFFTQPGCPFCERARREYLGPLARGTAWPARTLIREVSTASTLTGLDGLPASGSDIARAHGVRLFPTVLFVDAGGHRLADPLTGFSVPDFYGASLEARLETAIRRLSQ
jgi:thioredoxin-related protein